jgi:osmoprotectant transport system permease protein
VRTVAAEPLVRWDWIADHTDDIVDRSWEHLQLTAWAIAIGSVLSLGLAIVALRYRRTNRPITWAAGALYAIPSIALFAFLIPYTHLGFVTAEIGLVSYTLLILVRNTVAGVDGVPRSVKDAADGMGYEPWRRFLTVDLRLATPSIVAGLRVATVTVVGLVTITALVGAGGYGVFITDGLDREFTTPIILGASLSVLLAGAFELAFVVLERALTPWARRGRPEGTD